MKGSFKLQDAQQKKKAEEPELDKQPCVICGKVLAGAYGRWNGEHGEVWTCSRICEGKYMNKENNHAHPKRA